jgi:hypothetical protein
MATHNDLPFPQYAYVGPTYAQAKRIAWRYLKLFSNPYQLKPPSESELFVTLKNNAVIYCLGADNPDSLRGMYLDGFVGDEYALFRPNVFTEIIRPALSDRGGWGVFASTPRGRNLFFDKYRQAQRDTSGHHVTYLPASVSGILPLAELKDLKKDMSKEEYAQEYDCSFDSALKGAIYADEVNELFFDGRAINSDGPPSGSIYDPNLPTHFVYDLGFTDATVRTAFQYAPDGYINVVNVLATQGKIISDHIDSLRLFAQQTATSMGGIGEVWLPHDARAKNLQTGKSIVEQFIAANFAPRIVPNHHVKDRLAATRKVFPRVRIDMTPVSPDDPDTPVTGELMEALKAYRREWDDKLLVFSDQPVHDWASDYADSFGYMCVVCAPSITQMEHRSSDRDQEARSSQIIVPGMPQQIIVHTRQTMDELFLQHEAQQQQQPRMS